MTLQDFTTYTEVDTQAKITSVTSTKIDFADLERDDVGYVYKDFGAGFFSGDFTIKTTVNINARDNDAGGVVWSLQNSVQADSGETGNKLYLFVGGAGTHTFTLREQVGGSDIGSDSYAGFTLGASYYMTIERIGTAFTCKIYSDSGRTTLVDTLSITLASVESYRYIYGLQSFGTSPTQTEAMAGFTENLDIVANVDFTIVYGAFALTSQAMEFTGSRTMAMDYATFSLTGIAVGFKQLVLDIVYGAFTFTGYAVQLLINGSTTIWTNRDKPTTSTFINREKT